MEEQWEIIARDFLSQYLDAEARIKDLDEDLYKLNMERDSIQINLDGMPRGSATSNPTERIGIKIADLERKIAIEKLGAWSKWDAVRSIINSVEDKSLRGLLRARYMEGKSLEAVADSIGYSESRMYDLKKEAYRQVYNLLTSE